jgi:hypothetical protein
MNIPLVFQYNKRDLNYLIPVETFNNLLNPRHCPSIEAVAVKGVGVFESLREISKLTVPFVREKLFGERPRQDVDENPLSAKEIDDFEQKSPGTGVDAGLETPAAAPNQLTKVKVKAGKDIEDELDKLSREFVDK